MLAKLFEWLVLGLVGVAFGCLFYGIWKIALLFFITAFVLHYWESR